MHVKYLTSMQASVSSTLEKLNYFTERLKSLTLKFEFYAYMITLCG